MTDFTFQSILPFPSKTVADYHFAPGALPRLIPPWEDIRVLKKTHSNLTDGSEVTLSVPLAPGIRKRWLARHSEVNYPNSFTDQQITGPFQAWKHVHTFLDQDGQNTLLTDQISYRLPLAPISHLLAHGFVTKKLERTFSFRHKRTSADLHALTSSPLTGKVILITGASGLVGSNLKALLEVGGATVLTLSRSRMQKTQRELNTHYEWDFNSLSNFPFEAIERSSIVIHLAGENIASSRWTAHQKERIRKSRIEGTRLLIEALKKSSSRPATFLAASATGFYGDRGDEELHESSSPGSGFTSEVATAWEAESLKAEQVGIRTLITRFGIVLTPQGGALKKMLPAFQFGVAGSLGSGKQWMGCISIDDLLYAIIHLLAHEESSGIYNLVQPEPVTNDTFTRTLASLLKRPALIPAPALLLRLLLGEMADGLLLSSTRAYPTRLINEGFTFTYPDLNSALRFLLGIPR